MIDVRGGCTGEYRHHLQRSGYTPSNGHMWLKNWLREENASASQPPELPSALTATPVTYVSHAEASAYCRAVGKRLPSTIEWQYAAQGPTQRLFPWGDKDDVRCRPMLQSNRTIPGADLGCLAVAVSSLLPVAVPPLMCTPVCISRGLNTPYTPPRCRSGGHKAAVELHEPVWWERLCRQRLAVHLVLHGRTHSSRRAEGRQQLQACVQAWDTCLQPKQGALDIIVICLMLCHAGQVMCHSAATMRPTTGGLLLPASKAAESAQHALPDVQRGDAGCRR